MSRINQNVSSLLAQRLASTNTRLLTATLERLSTGFRINRGLDDPAGLIASENLRGEMRGISAAISNGERAGQFVNVADGALQEISDMLVEVQGLVGQSANEAGMSAEERDANQLQIDSILSSIDRIANATSFQGTKLLNGNFEYNLSGSYTAANGFADVTVNAARLSDAAGSTQAVTVTVTQSARTARAGILLSAGGIIENQGSGTVTFEIAGSRGAQQFSFASGTAAANIITAINAFKDATGVSASLSGSNVRLNSTDFGSEAFVRAREVANSNVTTNFLTNTTSGAGQEVSTTGRDATVNINGVAATARGLTARVALDGFDVSVTLIGNNAINAASQSRSFNITGGGADFNLAPQVGLAGKVSIGLGSVTTAGLGDSVKGFLSELRSGGAASLGGGNLTKAQDIVSAAIGQVSSLRGRLGAFSKYVVDTSVNSLNVAYENAAAAESAIRDTDFAAETARLTRNQILQQASLQALALSNELPRSVLKLLD
jgi:flagellin